MFQGLSQLVATTVLLSYGLGGLAVPHLPRQTNPTGTLHTGLSSGKCIDVRGAALQNGTAVQMSVYLSFSDHVQVSLNV